jgi:hypothetical protein
MLQLTVSVWFGGILIELNSWKEAVDRDSIVLDADNCQAIPSDKAKQIGWI